MNRNFINANVSLESLLNLDSLKGLVLPAADSALLLKNPSFVDSLVNNEVIVMKESELPTNIDFDIAMNIKGQILFSELIRIAAAKNQPLLSMAHRWGFDIKELPDNAYLLKAIYISDKNSPIIKALPIKSKNAPTALQKKFEDERLRLLVKELQTKGTTLKQKSAFDFTEIKDHIVSLQNIFVTYHLAKYEFASLKSGMDTALKLADTNPTVRSLLMEANVPKLISSPAWGISTPQNLQTLQAMQTDIDRFEIEYPEQEMNRGRGHRSRVNRS